MSTEKKPQAGGSYVRDAKGVLKKVESTQAAPAPTVEETAIEPPTEPEPDNASGGTATNTKGTSK